MALIAGQQLWNRRNVILEQSAVTQVDHGLELVNGGLDPQDIQVMFCFVTQGNPNDIEITAVTDTYVEFTNTGSGEGASDVTMSILFWMPHTMAGPWLNDDYLPNSQTLMGG